MLHSTTGDGTAFLAFFLSLYVGEVSVPTVRAVGGGGWTSRNTGRSHSDFEDVSYGSDMGSITAMR